MLEIVWSMSKILEFCEKDSRTFHEMDLALGKIRIISRKSVKFFKNVENE